MLVKRLLLKDICQTAPQDPECLRHLGFNSFDRYIKCAGNLFILESFNSAQFKDFAAFRRQFPYRMYKIILKFFAKNGLKT